MNLFSNLLIFINTHRKNQVIKEPQISLSNIFTVYEAKCNEDINKDTLTDGYQKTYSNDCCGTRNGGVTFITIQLFAYILHKI